MARIDTERIALDIGDEFEGLTNFRQRRDGTTSTVIWVNPDLAIEFQERGDGNNHVLSHRDPQEGVDFLIKDGARFIDPSKTVIPSCEVLDGPCVTQARSIGALHLGGDRLVYRAMSEAEVLADFFVG